MTREHADLKKTLNNQGNRQKYWQANMLNATWQKMFTQDFVPGKRGEKLQGC